MDIVRESRKVHKEHKEKVLETLLKQEQEKDEDNVTITIEIKIPKKGKLVNKIIDLTKD